MMGGKFREGIINGFNSFNGVDDTEDTYLYLHIVAIRVQPFGAFQDWTALLVRLSPDGLS